MALIKIKSNLHMIMMPLILVKFVAIVCGICGNRYYQQHFIYSTNMKYDENDDMNDYQKLLFSFSPMPLWL